MKLFLLCALATVLGGFVFYHACGLVSDIVKAWAARKREQRKREIAQALLMAARESGLV